MKTQYLLFSLASCLVMTYGEELGHFYCGRNLAETLAYVCDLQNTNLVKRFIPYQGYSAVPEFSGESFPWLGAQRARVLNTARGKRQVAAECCDKPCTMKELVTYC